MVNLCLVACITANICYAPPGACNRQPLLPDWATDAWVYEAAGIVAGETVPDCATCDAWIACTIVGDVELRGYHPWRLWPSRWHGWREPGEGHLRAVREALEGRCGAVPNCAYLGSLSDYTSTWRYGLASERQVLVLGNGNGAIVCIQ